MKTLPQTAVQYPQKQSCFAPSSKVKIKLNFLKNQNEFSNVGLITHSARF